MLKDFLISMLFIVSIALAGSDGDYFPWANIAGAIGFMVFCAVSPRTEGGCA